MTIGQVPGDDPGQPARACQSREGAAAGARARVTPGRCSPTVHPRMPESRPTVLGLDLDGQTRCAHWRSPLDIVAIRMRCCGAWYACKDCHDALAGHAIEVWPRGEWDQPAVLCGACGGEMSVRDYLDGSDHCPACGAPFNPGCRAHRHFYFEVR